MLPVGATNCTQCTGVEEVLIRTEAALPVIVIEQHTACESPTWAAAASKIESESNSLSIFM